MCRKAIFLINILIFFYVVNLLVFFMITDYRQDNYIGRFEIFDMNKEYEVVNIGRSIGADFFVWKVSDDINGVNFGRAGKPLKYDLELINFYENSLNTNTLVILPITFSFFCSDESSFAPYESIYRFNLPLFGMVQTNASIEYLLYAYGLRNLSDRSNFVLNIDNTKLVGPLV
jgi:hypothetical protein